MAGRIRWRQVAALLLVAISIVIVLALRRLPALVESAALAHLHDLGVSEAALRVEGIGPHGVRFRDVELGRPADLIIRRGRLRWSPLRLLRRRLEVLELEGVELRVVREAGESQGWSLGALDPLLGAGPGDAGSAGAPAWVVRHIELEAAQVELALPGTRLWLEGDARVDLDRAGIRTLDAALRRIEDERGTTGTLRLSLGSDGALESEGDVRLRDAERIAARLPASLPEGTATPEEITLSWRLEGRLPQRERSPQRSGPAPLLALDLRPAAGLRLTGVVQLDVRGAAPAPGAGSAPQIAVKLDLALEGSGDPTGGPDPADPIGARPDALDGRLAPGGGAALTGALAVEAALDGPWTPGLSIDRGRASGRLAWRLAGGGLEIEAPECLALAAEGVRLEDGLRTLEPLALCVRSRNGPTRLRLDAAAASARGDWEIAPTALALGDAGAMPRLSGTTPRLALRLDLSADAPTLEIDARGGRLRDPARALVLSELEARAHIALGDARPHTLRVDAARLEHDAPQPQLHPLRLSGVLTAAGDDLRFQARLDDLAHPIALHVDGDHDVARGEGHADLRLDRVTLAPGGIEPQHLAPALGGLLRQVRGGLAASGRVGWSEAGIAPDYRVELDGLSLESRWAALEGAQGSVRFDRFWPLRTPGEQQIRFARLDPGVPIRDGRLSFALGARGQIEQLRGEGRMAGGTLRTEGSLDFDRDVPRVLFRLERVDLAQLLERLDAPDLQATGSVDGELPLSWEDGAILVRGRLEATPGGGTLRYRPERPPASLQAAGPQGIALLEALRDFRYRKLSARFEGRLDRSVHAVVELEGHNPAVQGGRPIQLTVDFTSVFEDLARALGSPIAAP